MKLLDQIIDAAVSDTEPLSTLLRRCLVLEQRVKNEKLRAWVDNELDGYGDNDELPDYRVMHAISKGLFLGGGGAQISNQPLSLSPLSKEHREFIETLKLRQPASSYEARPDKQSDAQIPWPPSLTVKYQSDFIKGYALNRAWQEIPGSFLIALVDTVRTRVLRFALDLREELGEVSDDLTQIPPAKIDQSVVNYIYGGNNVIASSTSNISQIGSITITHNDLGGLIQALQGLGFGQDDLQKLTDAIEKDNNEQKSPTIGTRAKGWLKQIGKAIGKEGLKVGADIAKQAATKWLMQYYGFDL